MNDQNIYIIYVVSYENKKYKYDTGFFFLQKKDT